MGKKPKAPAVDRSAEIAEQQRQDRIRQGRGEIDGAYAQYDDQYYDKYFNDYNAYYAPQVQDQYTEAVDLLTARLAGKGQLESTSGANQMAKLAETLSREKTNVANQGLNAKNDLRSKVQSSKTDLYNLNQSSADPAAMSAQARAAAATYATPPAFSPLGQLFTDALQPAIAAYGANAGSANPRDIGASLGLASSGNSSGRTVGVR